MWLGQAGLDAIRIGQRNEPPLTESCDHRQRPGGQHDDTGETWATLPLKEARADVCHHRGKSWHWSSEQRQFAYQTLRIKPQELGFLKILPADTGVVEQRTGSTGADRCMETDAADDVECGSEHLRDLIPAAKAELRGER